MNKHKGFTIIEVVLVLAIAGLIFMMVFITLPALQRNQRDALRKRHAQTVADAAQRLLVNNKNRSLIAGFSSTISDLVSGGYLVEDEIRDPSTNHIYELDPSANGGNLYANYQNIEPVFYGRDTGHCEGGIPKDTASGGLGAEGRNMVYVFGLEGGGWVCSSNVMK